jgi:hypothetical protein
MQKALLIIGFCCIAAGLLWPWVGKIPFGRLPGDIIINRPHIKIYIPITTMIIISILLSLILRFFKK